MSFSNVPYLRVQCTRVLLLAITTAGCVAGEPDPRQGAPSNSDAGRNTATGRGGASGSGGVSGTGGIGPAGNGTGLDAAPGGEEGSGGEAGRDAYSADRATSPADVGQSSLPAVFSQSFDTLATGSAWLKSCKWNKHTKVTDGCGTAGSKCLRIAHDPDNREPPLFPLPPVEQRPPYPAGSKGVCAPYYTNTGTDVVQAIQPLPPADEYTLAYDIFFEEGFDWARAGKLPGLSAKEWDSGCSVEGDGLATDPGPARWSVRPMWRELGTTELYVYDQDRLPGACGQRAPTPVPFTTGKWFAVSIYVRLNSNTTGKDGIARMYFDGQLVRSEEGLRLRAATSAASRITSIFFSTFMGGNESKRLHCQQNPGDTRYCLTNDPKLGITWVPARVSHTRFDNVAVYPGLHIRQAPGM